MAYSIPNGGAVNADFTQVGYAAPLGNNVDANFTEATGPKSARAQFSLAWGAHAVSIVNSQNAFTWGINGLHIVNAQSRFTWATLGIIRDRWTLSSAWSVAFAPSGRYSLNTVWSTEPSGGVSFQFGVAWSTSGVPSGRSYTGVMYSIVGVAKQLSSFQAIYASLGIETSSYSFSAAWETITYSVKTVDLWLWYLYMSFVDQSFDIPIVYEVDSEFDIPMEFTQRVDQSFDVMLALGNTVKQQFIIDTTSGYLEQEWDITLPLYSAVRAEFEIPIPLLKRVDAEFEIDCAILNFDLIECEFIIIIPLLNSSQVETYEPSVLVLNGEEIELLESDISVDEGQFGWSGSFGLAHAYDYDKFVSGCQFDAVIGGETYRLVLDGKQKSKSNHITRTYTIMGISLCARFATPRAKMVTKTWKEDITAREVAEELFNTTFVDWGILDWVITAPRLAAENEAPYDILSRIVGAAGGMVEAAKDGSVIIRYKYPVSTAAYDTHIPDEEFDDVDVNISSEEGIQLGSLVNRLRIMDVATAGFQDKMEFIPDPRNPAHGKLRVYPFPWRVPSSLEHTSLPIVSASLVGVRTEQLTETVEVLRGAGSLAKPIYSIDDFEYLYVDLGGIIFESDQNDFTTTSPTLTESLMRITYTIRYFEYDAVAFVGAQVQFLVREPDNV